MAARDAGGTPRARRRWGRWVLVAVVGAAVALRLALPAVVRTVLVEQGNAHLLGTLTIGDVDLSLLRGTVALEDIALRMAEAPEAQAPWLASRRLSVDVAWLALARGTVRIQDVTLEGLRLQLDRAADGELVLPRLRETSTPAEIAPPALPEPETPAADGWPVVIEHAAVRESGATIRDFVADPPATREITLPAFELRDLRLQPAADAAPGRLAVVIGVRDGTIAVRTKVRPAPAGFDVAVRIGVKRLPLDELHVHAPWLGWNASRGRLDGALHARMRAGGTLAAGGTLVLSDAEIGVPGEERPALALRRLEVAAPRIDVTARHAEVARAALDGLRLVVRPHDAVPLPLLRGMGTNRDPTDATEPAAPWRWAVGSFALTDAIAAVALEPAPLELALAGEARGLSSAPGDEVTLRLDLSAGDDGALAVTGALTLDPPRGTLTLRPAGVSLARLAAAGGALPVDVAGTLDGELELVAREDPVVVRGTLALTDFAATQPEGEDFRVAWKRLDLALRELRLAGVLVGDSGGNAATAEPARTGRRVDVDLARVELAAPRATLTRTDAGIVLPSRPERETAAEPSGEAAAPARAEDRAATAAVTADAATGATTEDAAVENATARGPTAEAATTETGADAEEPQPAPPPDEVHVRAERLLVRDGTLRVVDRAVEPVYRGTLRAIRVDATDLRVPENTIARLDVAMRAPGRAPLTLTSTRRGERVRVEGSIEDLPLAQFNPYATASGYSVAGGTLDLRSELDWTPQRYSSENRLSLDALAVRGAEGEALFRKRFGVPLQLALALLEDVNGRISLGVPVSGSRARGTDLALGSIVAEALARALLGALTSPLKLLGAVTLQGGRIADFAPQPIVFVAGRGEPTAEGAAQLAQLAQALAALPALTVTLHGSAGASDVRGLAEAAVLADLEDGGVLGGVRNLLSGGARDAIRDALAARARGEDGALDPDDAEQLDAWVAEQEVADDALHALARERAEQVQRFLVEAHAVAADRVEVGEPVVSRGGGAPVVEVEIG